MGNKQFDGAGLPEKFPLLPKGDLKSDSWKGPYKSTIQYKDVFCFTKRFFVETPIIEKWNPGFNF